LRSPWAPKRPHQPTHRSQQPGLSGLPWLTNVEHLQKRITNVIYRKIMEPHHEPELPNSYSTTANVLADNQCSLPLSINNTTHESTAIQITPLQTTPLQIYTTTDSLNSRINHLPLIQRNSAKVAAALPYSTTPKPKPPAHVNCKSRTTGAVID